jgi:hypothetical protein
VTLRTSTLTSRPSGSAARSEGTSSISGGYLQQIPEVEAGTQNSLCVRCLICIHSLPTTSSMTCMIRSSCLCRFRIRDFDPYDLRRKLPKAVSRLAREHNPASGGTVYIHCTAGVRRPDGHLCNALHCLDLQLIH